jgi:hypothetical protein
MTATQVRSEAFEERNGFVDIVLGLVAAGQRFDRFLADQSTEGDAFDSAAEAPQPDPALIDTILGLIALGERVRSLVPAPFSAGRREAPQTVQPPLWRDLAR